MGQFCGAPFPLESFASFPGDTRSFLPPLPVVVSSTGPRTGGGKRGPLPTYLSDREGYLFGARHEAAELEVANWSVPKRWTVSCASTTGTRGKALWDSTRRTTASYVTRQWSLPHEWVHAAGLVDDGLGLWICEGLTEAVAEKVAAEAGAPYQPTYTRERRLVEEQLAPALRMSALELARQVVAWYAEGKSPAKQIAQKLGRPGLRKDLDRGSGDEPSEKVLKALRTTNARS